MRVLQYLDSLSRGGAEMQVLDVCRKGADAGLEITAVAAGGGALEDEFRDAGVEFIRLQRKFPVDIYLASQVRKIIREREIRSFRLSSRRRRSSLSGQPRPKRRKTGAQLSGLYPGQTQPNGDAVPYPANGREHLGQPRPDKMAGGR